MSKDDVVKILGLLAATVVLMTGCQDGRSDEESRAAADAIADDALAAVDGVVRDIAEATGMTYASGHHDYAICGETYAPRGVIHNVRLRFTAGDLGTAAAVDAAADALGAAGWTVERPGNDRVVIGVKGDLTVRIEYGAAAPSISVRSACVETSDDVALDYQNRDQTPITWE